MSKTIRYSDLVGAKKTDYAKVGKVSSLSVKKHTGKSWDQWVPLLEKAGARAWSHQEIVAYLKKKYRLTPWWQQGVTLGFEIATGRRAVGQDANGRYMVTATKTMTANVKTVWKELISNRGLSIWLKPLSQVRILPQTSFETKDGYYGEIRTFAPNRRIRMRWQDPMWEKPSVVELHLVAQAEKKSILVFNHTGIPDNKTREELRARWREAADRCAKLMWTRPRANA